MENFTLDLPLDRTSTTSDSSRKNSGASRSAIVNARKKSRAESAKKKSSTNQKSNFGTDYYGAPTPVLPPLIKPASSEDRQFKPSKFSSNPNISASNDDVPNISNRPRKKSNIQDIIGKLQMNSIDSLSSQPSVDAPSFQTTSQSSSYSRDSCFSDSDASSLRLSTESSSYVPDSKPEDDQKQENSEGSPKGVRVEPEKETPTSKVYKVASEILSTEIHYVKILGLIETVRG